MTAKSQVTSLTEFLAARLDEDEAEAASHAGPPSLRARQRREVEAKRAILAGHPAVPRRWIESCQCPRCEMTWPCMEVRALAAVYSDHPDYRQEWAP